MHEVQDIGFPFSHVVLTFPDERSAQSAEQGPLKDLAGAYPGTTIRATCDPFGARVGSGGGTLHAIQGSSGSVLVIHAGGESSRCPTQMVLGKAWTHLPTKHGLRTPIHIWLDQCSRLFRGIPDGSIVVVASDTLLRLPSRVDLDWERCRDAVVGLAVPAALETAKNHGVYVVDTTERNYMVHCQQVLQKPSIQVLEQVTGGADTAWIDTGVVVFPPKASAALRELSRGPLALCTGEGLQEASATDAKLSLNEFSRANAIKLDLYTHILHALSLVNSKGSIQKFLKTHSDMNPTVGNAIFESLNPFSMMVLGVDGNFLHLGTSRELVDFYVQGCNSYSMNDQLSPRSELCKQFGTSLGLVSRLDTLTPHATTLHTSSVVLSSCIESSTVGSASVVENSIIRNCQVGTNCLISGLACEQDELVRISDGMMIQQTPLQSGSDVIMTIGVNDNIKGDSVIFGRGLDDFLQWTGIGRGDLWGDGVTKPMLWNANLHPVVERGESFGDLFSWLPDSLERKERDERTLSNWKNCRRVSFAYIRNNADASCLFSRHEKLRNIDLPLRRRKMAEEVRDIILNKRHEHIEFTHATEEFLLTGRPDSVVPLLEELDSAMLTAMDLKEYNICGRALTVLSDILAGLSDSSEGGTPSDPKHVAHNFVVGISKGKPDVECISALASLRQDALMKKDGALILSLSDAYGQMARVCTSICVCPMVPTVQHADRAIFDKWVQASSPVRIDLAGGWTDTPPICLEFGSSVVGIAVDVDGRCPLACQARIVTGKTGISLKTENRSLSDGSLLSSSIVEVKEVTDLSDYNDPLSDCALLKCALVGLGLVSVDALESRGDSLDLQTLLRVFCRTHDERLLSLEIVSTSFLPHGSGLGTSSILAGCILAAVSKTVGITLPMEELILTVVLVEQLLTTGGGFQDQVNGLMGGAKLTQCPPSSAGLKLETQQIALEDTVVEDLNRRLIVVYTGKTRLAKNILQQVLRRWASRSPEITTTIQALIENCQRAQDALTSGRIDHLGQCLSDYWRQKKSMAGSESNVEPPIVSNILAALEPLILGGSLCGAGGGGFLVLVASESVTAETLEERLRETSNISTEDIGSLQFYTCRVNTTGISLKIED